MDAMTLVSGPVLDPRIVELSGETLVALLERAAARTPDAISLLIRRGMVDERWTYRQLAERSTQLAGTLQAAEVRHRDRVLTWSQNDPWLVAAYFAVWRLGAIIVPLDLRMQTDVAVRIGTRTDPTILLAGQGVEPDAAAALGVPIMSLDEHGLGLTIDESTEPPDHERLLADVGAADVAEILFTSGTTSDPKGVVLTHGQIVHTVRAIAQTGMGSRPDRTLGIIPLSHMYGQSVPLLMGLMGGSTLVFLHALSPKAISATMQRERITAVTLAPHLMTILLQGIESEARRSGRDARLRRARRLARWLPMPLRRLLFRRSVLAALGGALEIITSGGALLSTDLQEAWEAMGVRVIQGYGTTECAAVCGHSRERQRAGTVGRPLAGIEVRIAADGELLVRGPSVMRGYWEAPEATAAVIDRDGWFYTGDAARIDAVGEVVILGRTRDRISLPSGLNVYPEDVEGALLATGTVRAAVVFEPTSGLIAAALVPLDADSAEATLAAAVRDANGRLASHQKIRAWRRWPEEDFPRTHTLKIRRAPVRDWFVAAMQYPVEPSPGPSTPGSPGISSGERASAGQADVTADAVVATVAAVLEDTGGGDRVPITPETELASLDLDSLAAVTLALRIDEAFEAPLSDDEIVGAHDLKALCALVNDRQGQAHAPPPSRWAFSAPARLVRRLLDATLTGWAIRIVAHPRVEGLEHLEGLEGPVFVCPNHTSHLDAPVVRASLPSRFRDRSAIAAAADVWFDGGSLGPITQLALAAVPFGRSADVRASLERVGDLVNDGFNIIIFPEGTRSADGRLGPMREGIGLLATSLLIPVVPAYISGAHEILPKGARLPRRRGTSGIRIRLGEPLHFEPGVSVQEATAQVGRAVKQLADPWSS